jgi:hypothetical protein
MLESLRLLHRNIVFPSFRSALGHHVIATLNHHTFWWDVDADQHMHQCIAQAP